MTVERRRRFPPPWTVEETEGCFIIRDKNGQQLNTLARLFWPASEAFENLALFRVQGLQ